MPNRPHRFLDNVQAAYAFSDYAPRTWNVKVPRDGFLLSLAHVSEGGEGVLWVLPDGPGTVLISGFGSVFSNRALGQADNARLLANIVAAAVTPAGAVLFDDEHQGLSASYDPAKFYRDRRLYATLGCLALVWLVWVLGGTKLRMPPPRAAAPREEDLVRTTRYVPGACVAAGGRCPAYVRVLFPAPACQQAHGGGSGIAVGVARASSAGGAQRHYAAQGMVCAGVLGSTRAADAAAQSDRQNRKATRRMSTSIQQLEELLTLELGRVVIGAQASVHALVIALLSRGHVLVQGVPGLGKTLLAKTLARVLGGEFKRIQGTADLMPSDIIGVHVFDEATRNFVFRPGPLFADVVLVDEINRAGPKTQSALLEAMQERQVSVERAVLQLPAEFLVLATQNPREFEGTYPLPESQLDRFMLRIDMDYPTRAAEAQVLARYGGVPATAAGYPRRGQRAGTLAAHQLRATKRSAFMSRTPSAPTFWTSPARRARTAASPSASRPAEHWHY